MGEDIGVGKIVGRIPYIDSCRGFVILLVVVGHVVQCLYRPKEFDNDVLFRVIYAFHMPFFFFLSGYVSKSDIKFSNELIHVAKKRILQLILPFCLWGVYLNILDYEEPLYMFFLRPDHGLWFCFHLCVVIVYCSVLMCFSKIIPYGGGRISKIVMLVLGYLILKRLSDWNIYDYCQTAMLLYFYPYYAVGMLLGDFRNLLEKYQFSFVTTVLFIVAFFTLASVWYRVPNAIPVDAHQYVVILNSLLSYKYITAFLGIFATVIFFSQFSHNSSNFLIHLGKYSLGIYVIHFVIIKTFSDLCYQLFKPYCESFVGLVGNSILLLIITMILIGAIKKCKYVALITIGDVNRDSLDRKI